MVACCFRSRDCEDFRACNINTTIQYAVLLQGLVLVQQHLRLGGKPVTSEVVSRKSWNAYRENRVRQEQQQQQQKTGYNVVSM